MVECLYKKEKVLSDIDTIMQYAHFWNWLPDWHMVSKIYSSFEDAYSVLLPFAYSYLEELIRSCTSEYKSVLLDENGNEKYRKVGSKVVALAIKENENNNELVEVLNEVNTYFERSTRDNFGDNRNSVVHGYQHSRFWREEDFIKLIEYIAKLSPIAYDK